MTGSPIFLIGSPWFKDLTIQVGGKTLEIKTSGGDEEAFYVQSLKVNGAKWNKGWVDWKTIFSNGGKLEFVLGAKPVNWTTGDLPPMLGGKVAEDARVEINRWF